MYAISLAGVALFFLLLRFIWKPDVSPFQRIDFDSLHTSCGPVSRREKYSVAIYLGVIVLWLLPALSKQFFTEIPTVILKLNNCIPPLLALFAMNFIRVDGEKVLDWNDAVRSVNWGTVLFIASIMGLGSFMGMETHGISRWLSGNLLPVFGGVNPWVFLLIMLTAVNLLTNFCSNAVALSVIFAVALPLTMNIYSGQLSVALVAILITSGAQNGWATVPATPTAAVAYSAGYGDTRKIMKWGMLIMLLQILICILLGLWLARIIL